MPCARCATHLVTYYKTALAPQPHPCPDTQEASTRRLGPLTPHAVHNAEQCAAYLTIVPISSILPNPQEASTLRLGPLTPHAVRTLRHIRDFFGVTFSLQPERGSGTIFATCVGADVRNISRRVT